MLTFAQDAMTAETGAAVGWIGGVLSVVVTVVNAIISARAQRDRLQFDSERQRMGWRIETLEADKSNWQEAEQKCQKALQEVREELDRTRDEVKALTDYLLSKGVPLSAISPPPPPTPQ
jgi:uncharacterized coiled-coil protein SlyX